MPPLQSLSVKHFMVAHLLAQGKSQAEAARRIAVSPATVYNCMETPEFLALLETLKEEYAEKLQEKILLPFTEMQHKIDLEAAGSLERLVQIAEYGSKEDSVRLKANLALMDRSTNTPKPVTMNPSDSGRDLFSVSVVQLVLETALQVGDKSVLRSAQHALKQIPTVDSPDLPPIDVGEGSHLSKSRNIVPTSPFSLQSIEDAIYDAEEEGDYP